MSLITTLNAAAESQIGISGRATKPCVHMHVVHFELSLQNRIHYILPLAQ